MMIILADLGADFIHHKAIALLFCHSDLLLLTEMGSHMGPTSIYLTRSQSVQHVECCILRTTNRCIGRPNKTPRESRTTTPIKMSFGQINSAVKMSKRQKFNYCGLTRGGRTMA